jgi:glycosyltransferase involved in cell wall biosynthesis
MIVHNDVRHDSRVLKEATSLAAHGWKVVVVGVSLRGDLPEYEEMYGFTVLQVKSRFFKGKAQGRMQQLLKVLLAWFTVNSLLRSIKTRVYHAHDFTGLFQLATAGIWRRPIIYDSHELFFDRPFADVFAPIRYLIYAMRPLEKILARRAMGVITVSNPIADRLTETLRVPRPIVLYNAVDIRRTQPASITYETGGRKIVVHSGNIVDTRHLPELVEAISILPDEIALVLMGDGPIKNRLIAQAESLGIGERLVLVPPVSPPSIAPTLAQADIAAVLTTSTITNHNFSMGNKFFEAIAAGLPLVMGPNKEAAQLLKEYELGIICNPSDPTSIADAIRTLLLPENQARYRANAVKARDVLNWEAQERKLIEFYEHIFKQL